jgi:uncharacterized protein YaeQ
MALKPTIYKAALQIADMDRHYYADHQLTIARHPSENDERMMVRILAFAQQASEGLQFSKGLFDPDEPDLWDKDLTGAIQHWIDLGHPDDKRIRRACGRSERVSIYSYADQGSQIWWNGLSNTLGGLAHLSVYNISPASISALAKLVERGMQLQYTRQDGQIWLGNSDASVAVEWRLLKAPAD